MAKTRWTGRAARVEVLSSSTADWSVVGLTRSITPPGQQRATIDMTAMSDTYTVSHVGIEQESTLVFQALHDAEDTVDALITTYYNSGVSKSWRVRRNNGTHWFNSQFTGVVTAVRPQAFGGSDPVQLEVQVHRKSAITHSVAAVTS